MEPLSNLEQAGLSWIQPKARERFFELRSGDPLFATLSFRSGFGTMATAETAEGSWTFKRAGFLNPRISIPQLSEL